MATGAGPRRPLSADEREALRGRALAQLRQSIWEASQFYSTDRIDAFVNGVLAEIESDTP